MSESDTRTTIVAAINKILAESGRPPVAPADDAPLTSIGLDSLDLAVLVVSLEQSLGTDPFRDASSRAATIGQFVQLYEQALR